MQVGDQDAPGYGGSKFNFGLRENYMSGFCGLKCCLVHGKNDMADKTEAK